MKHKYSRKEIARKLLTEEYNYNQYGFSRNLVEDLLAPAEPITFKKLKKRLFKDPKVKEEYEKLKNTPDPNHWCNDCLGLKGWHERHTPDPKECECGGYLRKWYDRQEFTGYKCDDCQKEINPTPELKEIEQIQEHNGDWFTSKVVAKDYQSREELLRNEHNELTTAYNTLLKLMKK